MTNNNTLRTSTTATSYVKLTLHAGNELVAGIHGSQNLGEPFFDATFSPTGEKSYNLDEFDAVKALRIMGYSAGASVSIVRNMVKAAQAMANAGTVADGSVAL